MLAFLHFALSNFAPSILARLNEAFSKLVRHKSASFKLVSLKSASLRSEPRKLHLAKNALLNLAFSASNC